MRGLLRGVGGSSYKVFSALSASIPVQGMRIPTCGSEWAVSAYGGSVYGKCTYLPASIQGVKPQHADLSGLLAHMEGRVYGNYTYLPARVQGVNPNIRI